MEKISIVVPVFNMEKYIAECLESVLAQVYANFEVICVDDGSTDTSGQVCDEYSRKDRRFKTIHTANQGVGAARNLALTIATGEFCFFLDPDDLIAPGALDYMAEQMRKQKTDILLGASLNFRGDPGDIPSDPRRPFATLHTGLSDIVEGIILDKRDLREIPNKRIVPVVNYEFFSCLYRTSIIQDRNIRFLPISYGEDTYFCFAYLMEASTAVTTDRVTYLHRRNPTSTTFQYHRDYLEETKVYYAHYLDLFRLKAPAYLERAAVGLDAQYFFRCVSAVERELFIAGSQRTLSQSLATIAEVRSDSKFARLLTVRNVNCIPQKQMRMVMHAVRLRLHPPLVLFLRLRQRRRSHATTPVNG